MGIEEKAKATAKNLEGKAQEAAGKMTGDPEAQAEGKAKQAEAAVRQEKENIKDKAKEAID